MTNLSRATVELATVLLAANLLGGCTDRPTQPIRTPPRQPSLTIDSAADSLTYGTSLRLIATVRDTDGAINYGAQVTWTSSDTTLLTVDPQGRVTAIPRTPPGIDSAVVAARFGTQVARHQFVVFPFIKTIDVTGIANLRAVGSTDTVRAAVYGQMNDSIVGMPVVWTSSDPNVIAVSPTSGIVHVLSAGQATLTASLLGIHTSVAISTIPPFDVQELPGLDAGATIVALNDSNVIVGYRHGTGSDSLFYYRDGVTSTVNGCEKLFGLDERGDVLCAVTIGSAPQLATWKGGLAQPVPGFPGVPASARINDSGAIAFVADSGTALCPTARCLGIWHDGTVSSLSPPAAPDALNYFDDEGDVGIGVFRPTFAGIYNPVKGAYLYSAATKAWDGFTEQTITGANDISIAATNRTGVMVGSSWNYHTPTLTYWRFPQSSSANSIGPGVITDVNDRGVAVVAAKGGTEADLLLVDLRQSAPLSTVMAGGTWTPGFPQKINNRNAIVAAATNTTDGHVGWILLTPAKQ